MSANTKVRPHSKMQHRSNLLMEVQRQNVREVHLQLEATLQYLDAATCTHDQDLLRSRAAELTIRSQELVITFQVMDKINVELLYARADLKDVLQTGNGDMSAVRKRVTWLENKLRKVFGQKRLNNNDGVADQGEGLDKGTPSDHGTDKGTLSDHGTDKGTPSDHGTDKGTLSDHGTDIGTLSDLATDKGTLSDNGTDKGTPSDHGTDKGTRSDHGTDKGTPSDHGTDKGTLSDHGTDIGTLSDLATDKGTLSDNGTDKGTPSDHGTDKGTRSDHGTDKGTPSDHGTDKGTPSDHGTDKGTPSDHGTDKGILSDHGTDKGTPSDHGTDIGTLSDHGTDKGIPSDHGTDIGTPSVHGTDKGTPSDLRTDKGTPSDHGTDKGTPSDHGTDKRTPLDHGTDKGTPSDHGTDKEFHHQTDSLIKPYADTNLGGLQANNSKEREETHLKEEMEETHIFLTQMGGQDIMADTCFKHPVQQSPEEIRDHESRGDVGFDSWSSDHQHFEYSEFADVLTQSDPLSYHQIGLAIPGSFVRKEDIITHFQELPWRTRRRGSNVKDIHRTALDKLAAHVHGLYDQVYQASMVSVKPPSQQAIVSASWIRSETPSSVNALDAPRGTAGRHEPVGKEVGAKGPGSRKMMFYSKPVPSPQVLPMTMTSTKKECPLFASSFYRPGRDVGKPFERLVDQHGLQQETKLVLYREKVLASTDFRTHQMVQPSRGANRMKSKTGSDHLFLFTGSQGSSDLYNGNQLQSNGQGNTDLRWERVKKLVDTNLRSLRVEDRIDGAHQLGSLRFGDPLVTGALKERSLGDTDSRVRYAAVKSLIVIGCWEDEVMHKMVNYLVLGNSEMRLDLTEALIEGKRSPSVNKTTSSFLELVKVLSHFCRILDPSDPVALNAAICLSLLCAETGVARRCLITVLERSTDTRIKAQVLEILVRWLCYLDQDIIRQILLLLQSSPVWKCRFLACHLLASCGSENLCITRHKELIYQVLETCLWSDPSTDVKSAAVDAMTALEMFTQARDSVLRNLVCTDVDARARAVVALGVLGIKSEQTVRQLLDMVQLDSSDHVRLMVIRTFGALRLTDSRVVGWLRGRERLGGVLARESTRVLKLLGQVTVS